MTVTAAIQNAPDEESQGPFVFDDADWPFYELILKKLAGRRVFVTFDGERLEVMSPSYEHDVSAERLGQFVRILLTEQTRSFIGAGSFTLKKRRTNRGLEPDRCFYVRRVAEMYGKKKLDLRSDPPPDLAIEVEVSRRFLDRIEIYQRLGVPEVWCYDGQRLRVLQLAHEGYAEARTSPTFPTLPLHEVHHFLQASWGRDDLAWTNDVRAWARRHVLPPPA